MWAGEGLSTNAQQQINAMIQQSVAAAMQSLTPQFDSLRTDLQDLRTNNPSMEGVEHSSVESQRQDILNETLRESRDILKNTLRQKYTTRGISVNEADLDAIVADKGAGSHLDRDNVQKMRVDDLPKFDGRDVHSYLVSVTSAIVQFGQQAVARTIPRTFDGQARNWWNILSDSTKNSYMSNVYKFKDALEDEFSDSVGVAKDKAKNRTWRIGSEDIMTYYYDKMDLMVNANSGNHSDVEVCYEIREGLPIEFRPYIRTVLEKNPSTSRMRKELQSLENDFLKMWKSSRTRMSTPPLTPTSSFSPTSSPDSSISRSPTSFRRSRSEPPLRESYDPARVGQAPGPNGKMLRSYTLPSGQVLLLNRTCRVNNCNGNHFDFEHDHVTTRKRAASVMVNNTDQSYEGYPIADNLHTLPVVEEESSEEDEEPGMKMLSYTIIDEEDPPRRLSKRRGTKN